MLTQSEKNDIVNDFMNTMQNYNTMKKDINHGRLQDGEAERTKDADTWRVPSSDSAAYLTIKSTTGGL